MFNLLLLHDLVPLNFYLFFLHFYSSKLRVGILGEGRDEHESPAFERQYKKLDALNNT